MVKNLLAYVRDWVGKILKKEMANHSVFLPEKFHGHRSLVGYRQCGCEELYMIEQ